MVAELDGEKVKPQEPPFEFRICQHLKNSYGDPIRIESDAPMPQLDVGLVAQCPARWAKAIWAGFFCWGYPPC